MPFTPFHFGPGLLLKSVAPRRISVASYAAANVVIDVETAYHLVRHDATVHQWAHTFAGASVVGLVTGAALTFIATRLSGSRRGPVSSAVQGELSAGPILVGAILGAVTHPLLDGLMHPDIHPFRPFTDANLLRGLVSVNALQTACVLGAVLGALVMFARRATWMALGCLLLIAPTATRLDIALNTPMRLGELARGLPDADVLDLARVSSAHGVSPWLIRGPGDPLANEQVVDAYGTPTTWDTTFRRGPMTTMVRRRTRDGWQPWSMSGLAEYAQVAVGREGFVWLENDRDVGRPFRVSGTLIDRDLTDIVALIRSSPTGPGPGGETRVRGEWPIMLMGRGADGTVGVLLRAERLAGQHVTVRQERGIWTIVSIRAWVL